MGFRVRLAVFLVATLALVQALTAIMTYAVTRRELIHEGERQLGAAAEAFGRQLDELSERVADNVQVLALDFALREAIAQHDDNTVLSVLRNHGRRVGAARMMLIGLEGRIEADTQQTSELTGDFPFPDLLAGALERPASALVAVEGKAYWMIVVPVYAPAPIALIAAAIPVDDALLRKLQQLSTLPNAVELVSQNADGSWAAVARARNDVALTRQVVRATGALPEGPTLASVDGREYVVLGMHLKNSPRSAPVSALLGYSLDDALRPYRSVAGAWASLLILGLIIGLAGSLLIARGVSRPIEALAESARRIEGGDYRPLPPMPRTGEIGELASALSNMAQAIREREEHILFQAQHDATTGLANRQAAEAAIQQSLADHRSVPGALLMIGMARLPEIIQTMGHAICDRLMCDAGRRVRLLAGDGPVARATDTQFSLWLARANKAQAIAIAFQILDALGEPYQEADLSIDVAPAVGIALYPEHGIEATALLRRAEVALIAALGSSDPVVVYDPATDPHRPERLSLMGDLREALDHNGLKLYYQPKLNLSTRSIDSAEALLRWQHGKRGNVPPDEFIGLAEETGNIRRLTRWVLAASIAQAHEWEASGLALRVAVNISARDLDDPELPRRISELLAIHRVAPERIVLEITESAVIGEPKAAIQVLKRLADQGIDLAIDDFGVGQSSFSYLRRLPVRELKIDKSFVQKLASDGEDRAIVQTIVDLGHRLGHRVTAEGVEDSGTLDYLTKIGCDHAQGFYMAAALPPAEFAAFLAGSIWGVKR